MIHYLSAVPVVQYSLVFASEKEVEQDQLLS